MSAPDVRRKATSAPRDVFWEHCRNNLGIARLMLQERRPDAFVATASQMAVENACRAALAVSGIDFDGDLARAFERLAAPSDLWPPAAAPSGAARLAEAERAIGWVAAYLKAGAPERAWGY
jgi:GDP-D-mannose dehydratase